MSFITLRTYTYTHEMAIERGLLESEGIVTFVVNETISFANPFYSNPVGNIELLVLEQDFKQALKLLQNKALIHAETSGGLEKEFLSMAFTQRNKFFSGFMLVLGIAYLGIEIFQILTYHEPGWDCLDSYPKWSLFE